MVETYSCMNHGTILSSCSFSPSAGCQRTRYPGKWIPHASTPFPPLSFRSRHSQDRLEHYFIGKGVKIPFTSFDILTSLTSSPSKLWRRAIVTSWPAAARASATLLLNITWNWLSVLSGKSGYLAVGHGWGDDDHFIGRAGGREGQKEEEGPHLE